MSDGESEVTVGQQNQQSESKAWPEVKEHEDKLEPSKTNCDSLEPMFVSPPATLMIQVSCKRRHVPLSCTYSWPKTWRNWRARCGRSQRSWKLMAIGANRVCVHCNRARALRSPPEHPACCLAFTSYISCKLLLWPTVTWRNKWLEMQSQLR